MTAFQTQIAETLTSIMGDFDQHVVVDVVSLLAPRIAKVTEMVLETSPGNPTAQSISLAQQRTLGALRGEL